MKNQKDGVWMLKTLLPDSVTFSAWAGYCAFCLDAHTSSLDLQRMNVISYIVLSGL